MYEMADDGVADDYTAPAPDPLRPEAGPRGYTLPHPETGKMKLWMRATNHTKKAEDTYHLELWERRNVAKGVAILMQQGRLTVDQLASFDVKEDKSKLNAIAVAAKEEAGANKASDEGTAIHASVEAVIRAGGDINAAPERHHSKVRLYLAVLAEWGITPIPELVERVTVSWKYDCAGKFDNIFRLSDGTYALGDLKTGTSLDLSLSGYAAQMDVYRDGINSHGIYDGRRYDTSIKVRDDFAVIIHLPSDRDEVFVVPVNLEEGAWINEVNMAVRDRQKTKAKHVTLPLDVLKKPVPDATDAHWIERANAAMSVDQLMELRDAARNAGQWTGRVAGQFRLVAAELQKGAR